MTAPASGTQPNLKRVFTRGFAWAFTQSVGGLLIQAATLMVLSRILTPADFGIVAIAVSAVGVISLLVELGVGPSLIQQRELKRRHVGSALCISLGLGVVLMVACQALAAPAAHLLGMDDNVAVLRFMALIIALQPLITILSSLARRDFKMRTVATAELVAGTFGYSVIAVGLALLGYGYWSLAIAQISQLVINLLLLLWAERRRVTLRPGMSEAKDVLAFGTFFSIGRLANYMAQKFDRAMIGTFLGAEAAGNYQRILNMLQIIGPLAAGPLDAIMFPLLSRLQDDAGRLRRSYRATTAVAAMLTMPASLMMCVSAPVLVPLVLGSQWDAVVLPAQIMAATLFFRTNDSITATLVRSVGRVKERAVLQILYAVLSLGSIYVLRGFGLPGIALGLLAVTVLNFVLMSFLVRRVTTMSVMDNFTPLIPAAVATSCLSLVAGGFYAALDDALFTYVWMAVFLGSGGVIYLFVLLMLPDSWLPTDVANLRAALLQRVGMRIGFHRTAIQLDTVGQ